MTHVILFLTGNLLTKISLSLFSLYDVLLKDSSESSYLDNDRERTFYGRSKE